MPRAKVNRSNGPRRISCPQCGKKFRSETNVLQHMNQPSGSCGLRRNGVARPLHQVYTAPQPQVLPHSTIVHESVDPSHASGSQADRNGHHSGSIDGNSLPPFSPRDDSFPLGPGSDTADLDIPMDMQDEVQMGQPPSDVFMETYEGCSESFPGGTSFMDNFRQDKYAAERKENLYFPFASQEEWEFASWLLRSRLSLSAIDSLLSLTILRNTPLSFRTGKQLRSRAETLPSGPAWYCEPIKPEGRTKSTVHVFYRQPLECLQMLLTHPLLAPHTSFVPRKVWTSSAKICRIYEDWMSSDQAWDIQRELPIGSTVLGVVLSSDKTNISVMSGNRMAHPVLISLANIDPSIRSKISLHGYMLLALLPIPKFIHKNSRVRSLFQDRLFHQALDHILNPLKIAASVGVMMNDPVGNLRYCYTPLVAWISDTPEQGLLSGTNPKASPVTTAKSKNFGDPFRHPARTSSATLAAMRIARAQEDPPDYKSFLKAIRELGLNGVLDPVWMNWLLSSPSSFLHTEVLHHVHRFCWDHDCQWCIAAMGAQEIDFRFSLIQTSIGYRSFGDGISKLKQVTGRDHRAIQRYLIGVIAGAVSFRFLVAVRSLMDFRYLAQAPSFTDDSLQNVSQALQDFHEHKDAIVRAGGRKDNWEIPKLELLQSVVPDIRRAGPIMQWSADPTEHAHVQEIKVPARAGNNQNYYNQIARHLDRSEKCLLFDIATYLETQGNVIEENGQDDHLDEDEDEDEHKMDSENISLSNHLGIKGFTRINYFETAVALSSGRFPNSPQPHRTFSSTTSAFHIALKPSLRLSIDEAATTFNLPDLRPALHEYFFRVDSASPHTVSGVRSHEVSNLPSERIQIWYKIRVQQMCYHTKTPDAPQTLRAIPPSADNSYGLYDAVVVNAAPESSWPKKGLDGHSVVQLRMVFRLHHSDQFLAYVQRFDAIPQRGLPTHPGTGMHLLRRAVRPNGSRVGDIIPVALIRSPAHLIPNFGDAAHNRLTHKSGYELSNEFWLNKYWSKESFYSLHKCDM